MKGCRSHFMSNEKPANPTTSTETPATLETSQLNDEDRDAIVSRRDRFVAAALSSMAGAAMVVSCAPQPGLSQQPRLDPGRSQSAAEEEGGTIGDAGGASDAADTDAGGSDSATPDASGASSNVDATAPGDAGRKPGVSPRRDRPDGGTPMPCLSIIAPPKKPPPPVVQDPAKPAKPEPPAPMPCLSPPPPKNGKF